MRRFTAFITLILIILAAFWSIKSAIPSYSLGGEVPDEEYSIESALDHVKAISDKPHAVGFEGHTEVREYIANYLQELGLEVQFQEGYTAGDWGNLSKAINILARIEGKEAGKALLLLSHYDSSPHSSLGASDAGSGVATILEGVRAYLAAGKTPKNDIIILITDAEELGLNGADLFVNEHPWSKEVGLVLNFEARGSGGPSYMLIETNGGNAALIDAFSEANPSYPVAKSLAYSIYKMLPNDTDLTVFREDGDIDGFNFAFIDDHFDYHTYMDSYERLDKSSLNHQASYLMPLLAYFSKADLNTLKSNTEKIYFNVPLFRLVSYPYSWGWYLVAAGWLFFLLLILRGIKLEVLNPGSMLSGFLPMLLSILINGLIGYFAWKLLTGLYPSYKDILHGFPYNGHLYILAFALLSIGIVFLLYHRFRKISVSNLLIAPLFLWLVICSLLTYYLPGAGFMIIPVFGCLVGLMVVINQEKPNAYLLWFLGLPAIVIFVPSIQMFPVGLGLKMMITVTLLTSLTFFLLLPLVGFYQKKKRLALLSFLATAILLIMAHSRSSFTESRPKPTSLLYVKNTVEQSSYWATYENVLSDWTSQYIGQDKENASDTGEVISSKYWRQFTYSSVAPQKDIAAPELEITRDTILEDSRFIELCINPQRDVNRLDVFTNFRLFELVDVNGIPLSDKYLSRRRGGKLVTHYISENDPTEIRMQFPKDSIFELTLYEASNDLLQNELFSVPGRDAAHIPMPFVLNDAILTISNWTFE